MKKFLPLALFTLCFFIKAQTYTFDYMLTNEYSSLTASKNKKIFESNTMISSQTNDYELKIFSNGTANLYDYKRDINHKFLIYRDEKSKVAGFDYIETRNQDYLRFDNRNAYIIEKIDENEFLIKTFITKKAKQPYVSFQVKLKESTDQIIILEAHMNLIAIKEITSLLEANLDGNKKYVIESYIVENEQKRKTLHKYKAHSKINLVIEVKNRNDL